MFLKPLVFFAGLSSPAVSCASLSTFSAVSGSPGPAAVIASPLTEPLVEFGGEVDRAVGEVERVTGGLTATESASDVAVERDVCEPVRRSEAARRGRVAGLFGGVLAPMRAASWLSEGRRPPEEGRSGFECSGPGCGAVEVFALIAGSFVVAAAHKGQPHRASSLSYYFVPNHPFITSHLASALQYKYSHAKLPVMVLLQPRISDTVS